MWKLSTADRRRRAASRARRDAVDAAEHQRGIAQIELGQPVEDRFVEHIALVAGLERAAERALVQAPHLPRVDLALLEAVIGVINERLLSSEIGVMLRHGSVGATPGRAGNVV